MLIVPDKVARREIISRLLSRRFVCSSGSEVASETFNYVWRENNKQSLRYTEFCFATPSLQTAAKLL